jgi:hypothetical protein
MVSHERGLLTEDEIRGLLWGDIDLKAKQIVVQHNFVRFDSDKAPHKDSTGVLPLAPEIESILEDLQTLRTKLGYTKPDDFVIPGPPEKRPSAILPRVEDWNGPSKPLASTRQRGSRGTEIENRFPKVDG